MTNAVILQKAMEKAVLNGYEFPKVFRDAQPCLQGMGLIFSHAFAKAFFDRTTHKEECDELSFCTCLEDTWIFHLQIMVLEEDPIKYLEDFI